MAAIGNLFIHASGKTKGIYGVCADANGDGLPQKLSPWLATGVLRPDQTPPHGLSRQDIESGVRENGYQLWRQNTRLKG